MLLSPLLNHIKGNTSSFGSAIQVLPSDIRKYFSSFLITAVAVVFISVYFCYWKLYFFMDVNSYVGKKVDLTYNYFHACTSTQDLIICRVTSSLWNCLLLAFQEAKIAWFWSRKLFKNEPLNINFLILTF